MNQIGGAAKRMVDIHHGYRQDRSQGVKVV